METVESIVLKEEEVDDIIALINDFSGYDFSEYSRPSLLRRMQRFVTINKITNLSVFQDELIENSQLLNNLIEELTVNVTEMFRDPLFFTTIKNDILTELEKLSHIKIWHAGCSTGEEVYSMMILLHEKKLLEKSIVYATDINQTVLSKAREGKYSLENMKEYAANYKSFDTNGDFNAYFDVKDGAAQVKSFLKEKVIFSAHNLVSEGVFNQFDLIVCRNVLIYFNKQLQDQVFIKFYNSLNTGGFLAIGSKETLQFSPIDKQMDVVNQKWKIWRKKVS